MKICYMCAEKGFKGLRETDRCHRDAHEMCNYLAITILLICHVSNYFRVRLI